MCWYLYTATVHFTDSHHTPVLTMVREGSYVTRTINRINDEWVSSFLTAHQHIIGTWQQTVTTAPMLTIVREGSYFTRTNRIYDKAVQQEWRMLVISPPKYNTIHATYASPSTVLNQIANRKSNQCFKSNINFSYWITKMVQIAS